MENRQASRLTRRQLEILEFVGEFGQSHGFAPSLEALCEGLGLRSRGSMHKHVQALVSAGLVEPMDGRKRGVHLTSAGAAELEDADSLPLVGTIAAGRPIEALEHPERIGVPPQLRTNGECFVLRVRGDSMIEDGIHDGDWVVIERRSHARNGEVVVALIDRSEATLKRIEQHPDRVVLHPANSTMAPIIYAPHRVEIQGVVVGQMRRY